MVSKKSLTGFHSWFDRLTMNGISITYIVRPEPVEGPNGLFTTSSGVMAS